MNFKPARLHIGLRTAKTAAAVIISMVIVDYLGTSASKLIFAMLGAMAAVQPTFKESLESCFTQIVGVLFGALVGVVLSVLPISNIASTGIGIVLVIILYNALHIRFSPSIPCFIVVTLCTTSDLHPIIYALERIWDTAIGLSIGMLINTLVFPYDNSRKIRSTAESLDKELLLFLEDMFDGDEKLPDADQISKQIDILAKQLKIFSNQKLIHRLRRQKEELESFRRCEGKAKMLVAQMEVFCRMGRPGALNTENKAWLEECGAQIKDARLYDPDSETDIITNYHVRQILQLREALLEALNK